MEPTTRHWLVRVTVATNLADFTGDNPFAKHLSLQEARSCKAVGLPVLLDCNERRRVGTVIESTVDYRTWSLLISVYISDFNVHQARFIKCIAKAKHEEFALRQMTYENAVQIVPCETNDGMLMRRTWLKSFSFVHTGLHEGSQIESLVEQTPYNSFTYPLLKSSTFAKQ